MQPNPMAETSKLLFPNVRFFINPFLFQFKFRVHLTTDWEGCLMGFCRGRPGGIFRQHSVRSLRWTLFQEPPWLGHCELKRKMEKGPRRRHFFEFRPVFCAYRNSFFDAGMKEADPRPYK